MREYVDSQRLPHANRAEIDAAEALAEARAEDRPAAPEELEPEPAPEPAPEPEPAVDTWALVDRWRWGLPGEDAENLTRVRRIVRGLSAGERRVARRQLEELVRVHVAALADRAPQVDEADRDALAWNVVALGRRWSETCLESPDMYQFVRGQYIQGLDGAKNVLGELLG